MKLINKKILIFFLDDLENNKKIKIKILKINNYLNIKKYKKII